MRVPSLTALPLGGVRDAHWSRTPECQAPWPLPILRSADELPKCPAVLSGSPAYLARVAEPLQALTMADVGAVRSHPKAAPIIAASDNAPPVAARSTVMMNSLRDPHGGSVGEERPGKPRDLLGHEPRDGGHGQSGSPLLRVNFQSVLPVAHSCTENAFKLKRAPFACMLPPQNLLRSFNRRSESFRIR